MRYSRIFFCFLCAVAALSYGRPALAGGFLSAAQNPATQSAQGTNVAYQPPEEALPAFNLDKNGAAKELKERSDYVFSAPPRGDYQHELAVYKPIADYLSRVTGKHFVFQYSDNWLSYSKDMTDGAYDLVFDGPAFNGWRMDRLGHTPLVKLPEPFIFAVITKANDRQITDIASLAGHSVCAHAPPNLGTLTLLGQFSNPSRQPYLVVVKGWDKSYQGLMQGKCEATILPLSNLEKYDNGPTKQARIIYQARPLPNQAFSAGPRIPPQMQKQIQQALLSSEGRAVTAKLLADYASKDFVPATRQEYAGLGALLKDSLYYQY
ncbi:MAG: phosphate/phosphite/phosphonate ABC transporter substrate-binding protein [Acidiferrobacterales bacterium]